LSDSENGAKGLRSEDSVDPFPDQDFLESFLEPPDFLDFSDPDFPDFPESELDELPSSLLLPDLPCDLSSEDEWRVPFELLVFFESFDFECFESFEESEELEEPELFFPAWWSLASSKAFCSSGPRQGSSGSKPLLEISR